MSLRRLYGPLVRILCVAGVLVAVSATLALGTGPDDAVQVSENGNSDYPARRAVTAVTASGQQLVVWQQEDYGKSDLWGRVVDEQGTVVGEPFQVSRTGEYALDPAVAARGRRNEFLVAWDGSIAGKGGGIVAWRFSGDGRPLGEKFLVAEGGQLPALAYSGKRKEFVVVWSGTHREKMYGARLPAGTSVTPEPFPVAQGGSDRFVEKTTLACDSRTGRCLAGWDEVDYGNTEFFDADAYVRTLPAEPSGRLGRIHRLPHSKEDRSSYPNLAYNRHAREYLALFSGTHLRRVNAEGRPYGRELAQGYRRDTGLDGRVRVEDVIARPEGGYTVLIDGWQYEEGPFSVYTRRVSPTLDLRRWVKLVAENANAYDGSLAYSRVQERTRTIWLQQDNAIPPPRSYDGWEIWTRGL